MRTRAIFASASFLLVLAVGCANPSAAPSGTDTGSEATRYEADGTVLESQDHGPELCLGVITDSLPPQCRGLPISNWNWDGVRGEDSDRGTTWGQFHLVGTYEGTVFSVLEVSRYQPPLSESPDFTAPCPVPPGGWVVVDATHATDADLQAVMRAAEDEPDSAGFWIDYVREPMEGTRAEGIIAIAAFTGDLERHEAELREVWGGPLCVTQHERTYAELRRIQKELGDEVAEELGLQTTWSSGDVVGNRVEVGVVVADEAAVAAVEERYGAGAVLLIPALEPVPAG